MFVSYLSSSLDSLRPAWDWLPVAQCYVCCSERGQGCTLGPIPHLRSVESPHPQTRCIHGAHRALVGDRLAFVRYSWFPGGTVVKSLPAPQEMQVLSLGWEDPN